MNTDSKGLQPSRPRPLPALHIESAFISVHQRLKKFRVVGVVRGFRLNRDRREALSYVLRPLRSIAANESVSIGIHPWLNQSLLTSRLPAVGPTPQPRASMVGWRRRRISATKIAFRTSSATVAAKAHRRAPMVPADDSRWPGHSSWPARLRAGPRELPQPDHRRRAVSTS